MNKALRTLSVSLSILLVAQASICSGWAHRTSHQTGPTATIKNGSVIGVHSDEYDQDFFLGVPYAQPPLGGLRFRNPQSLNTAYPDPLSADRYPPDCMGYNDDAPVSEDCLYLNVIRPSNYAKQPLPVAVWIYGGGLRGGGTADPYYNLSFIVENSVKIGKPVIAVSFNYRLSGWGFLSSQEVTASGNTNIGLRDQRLALHWIQENIAGFGGDSREVTIWGESAGAASVGWHLTAYNGRNDGLFRAAIMESGGPINYNTYPVEADYQPTYDTLVNITGCVTAIDTLDCVRHAPFDLLNDFFNSTDRGDWNFSPIVDGDFIQHWGSVQLKQGKFVHVPIIDGANTDEGTSFAPDGVTAPAITTDAEFEAYAANDSSLMYVPAAIAPEALLAYPVSAEYHIPSDEVIGDYQYPSSYGGEYRRTAAFAGDVRIIANRRATCEAWAENGLKAYCYRFNIRPAGMPFYLGVRHFAEVAWVFDNVNGYGYREAGGLSPFQNEPQAYVEAAFLISASWVSFIHDLDPNSWKGRRASTPVWPLYDHRRPQNIVWDANCTGLAYVEDDTWRKSGIQWIIDHAMSYKR